MSYILVLTIVAAMGDVSTQRVSVFGTYQTCATFAVASERSQQELHPDDQVTWACQIEEKTTAVPLHARAG